VLLKNQTSWSEQNPFPTALEQGDAKTRFQIPHLLRNTRLRNSEPVSRPAKTSRFGNREKIAEVADIERLQHGEGILFGGAGKCNQQLDPECVRG
jgi:hypothetical protein